jgi:hypothetical protein
MKPFKRDITVANIIRKILTNKYLQYTIAQIDLILDAT